MGQLSPCCLVNTASPKASQFLGVANFTCGRAHLSNTNPSIQSPHTEYLSSLPHTTPSPSPEQLGTFLGLTPAEIIETIQPEICLPSIPCLTPPFSQKQQQNTFAQSYPLPPSTSHPTCCFPVWPCMAICVCLLFFGNCE